MLLLKLTDDADENCWMKGSSPRHQVTNG